VKENSHRASSMTFNVISLSVGKVLSELVFLHSSHCNSLQWVLDLPLRLCMSGRGGRCVFSRSLAQKRSYNSI